MHPKPIAILKCAQCGGDFPVYTNREFHRQGKRYCSDPCRQEARKHTARTWAESHREQEQARHAKRYFANREDILSRQKEYYKLNSQAIVARQKAHPGYDQYHALYRATHKPEISAHNREYWIANKQEIIEQKRLYNESHRQEHQVWHAAYYESHKELYFSKNRRRRARLMDASGSHTIADIQRLFLIQNGRCAACARTMSDRTGRDKYQVDHVKALVNGGSDDAENLQLLCARCNASKRDKDDILWAQEYGRLFC